MVDNVLGCQGLIPTPAIPCILIPLPFYNLVKQLGELRKKLCWDQCH